MTRARRDVAFVSLMAIALFSVVFGGAVARASETSPEDLATARTLFQQGSGLVNAGRYAEGCPKLELAQRLVMGIGVTLYLGECYEKMGRVARAWEQFEKARALADSQHDSRAGLARERARRLWPKLSKMTLVVPQSTEVTGLVLTDDGVEVDGSTYNVERPAEPGTHRLRASAPGHEPWEITVDVPAAGTIGVEVPQLPASPTPGAPASAPRSGDDRASARDVGVVLATDRPSRSAAPVVPRTSRSSAQRVAAIALFGAGLVGGVVGTVFGFDAKSKMDDSNASGHCQAMDRCDAVGLADRSSALNAATVSTTAFIGGLACVAGGAALYLTAPDDGRSGLALVPRLERGSGSLGLQGRW